MEVSQKNQTKYIVSKKNSVRIKDRKILEKTQLKKQKKQQLENPKLERSKVE